MLYLNISYLNLLPYFTSEVRHHRCPANLLAFPLTHITDNIEALTLLALLTIGG